MNGPTDREQHREAALFATLTTLAVAASATLIALVIT